MANTKITKKATRQLVYKKIEGALAKIKGEVKEKKFDKKLHKASNILAKDIVKAAKKDPPKKGAAKKDPHKKAAAKKAAAKKVKAKKKAVIKKTAAKKTKSEKPDAKKIKSKKAAKKAKNRQPKPGNVSAGTDVDQISETVTP